jgi:hypothetical protein
MGTRAGVATQPPLSGMENLTPTCQPTGSDVWPWARSSPTGIVRPGYDAPTDPIIFVRTSTVDYHEWLNHVKAAAACRHPIRLEGQIHVRDKAGNRIATFDTATMPDGVIYTPRGDRRAKVCPSCAEVYRRDTYQPACVTASSLRCAAATSTPAEVPSPSARPSSSARTAPSSSARPRPGQPADRHGPYRDPSRPARAPSGLHPRRPGRADLHRSQRRHAAPLQLPACQQLDLHRCVRWPTRLPLPRSPAHRKHSRVPNRRDPLRPHGPGWDTAPRGRR